MSINGESLADATLEQVNGGMGDINNEAAANAKSICPECGRKTEYIEISGGRRKCLSCGRVYEYTLNTSHEA